MEVEEKQSLKEKIKDLDSQILGLMDLREKFIAQLNSFGGTTPDIFELSCDEKVKLFRSYFRGRDEVHAKLWISRKTGKRGYSPACKNEWVTGICNKTAMKCAECPNREFVPLDDVIIRKHIWGDGVIGVYPMLANEHCYFLAVDFDKEGWLEDALAFKETCFQKDIPAVIERSRSGNGAHVWIFFDEEIPLAKRDRGGDCQSDICENQGGSLYPPQSA